jgi:hypothetical protein
MKSAGPGFSAQPDNSTNAMQMNSHRSSESPIAALENAGNDVLSQTTAQTLTGRILRRLRNGCAVGKLLPAYVLFGVLKHFLPLDRLARRAWRDPAGARDRYAERQLIENVFRLSRLVGLSERDCLQCSLLLYRALSRMGAEPTLFIGFRQASGRIIGHAWVVVDDRAVIDSEAELLRFSTVAGFGSRGVPLHSAHRYGAAIDAARQRRSYSSGSTRKRFMNRICPNP